MNEKDTAAKIVVVKGVIKGTANVRIGSNKSVIGLPGAGKSCQDLSVNIVVDKFRF